MQFLHLKCSKLPADQLDSLRLATGLRDLNLRWAASGAAAELPAAIRQLGSLTRLDIANTGMWR